EDVRVEHAKRIDGKRVCHPCHVPDGQLSIAIVDAAHASQLERDRISEHGRKDGAHDHHGAGLVPAAAGRPVGPVILLRRSKRNHRLDSASMAVNVMSTPRLRKSREPGSSRCGVNPWLDCTDSSRAKLSSPRTPDAGTSKLTGFPGSSETTDVRAPADTVKTV